MTTGPPDEQQPDDVASSRGWPDGAVADSDDEEPFGAVGHEDADDNRTALPPKVEAWRKRSATGAILTGFALGLQQALEPKRDEPQITVQTSGDPPADLPVEAEFEFRRPRHSVVNIRPWLLRRDGDDAGPEGPTDPDEAEGRN